MDEASPEQAKPMNGFGTADAVRQVNGVALGAIIDNGSASLDRVVRLGWRRQGWSNRFGAAKQVLMFTRLCSGLIEPLALQNFRADNMLDRQLDGQKLLSRDFYAIRRNYRRNI